MPLSLRDRLAFWLERKAARYWPVHLALYATDGLTYRGGLRLRNRLNNHVVIEYP